MAKSSSLQLLLSVLQYDPDSGDVAFTGSNSPRIFDLRGYKMVSVDGHIIGLHRLIWMHANKTAPSGEIDHINGDRGDNRICNLRDVSASVNRHNQRKCMSTNKTGLLGVSKFGKGFRAQISAHGVSKYLGTFKTPETAHEAYLSAKRQLHEGNTL
jgi:hypothetical protein